MITNAKDARLVPYPFCCKFHVVRSTAAATPRVRYSIIFRAVSPKHFSLLPGTFYFFSRPYPANILLLATRFSTRRFSLSCFPTGSHHNARLHELYTPRHLRMKRFEFNFRKKKFTKRIYKS